MVDDTDESTQVRVNVRTTEQRRDRWKAFASDHSETRYMSDLIHTAVAQYIDRHEGDGPRHGDASNGGLDDETATALLDGLNAVDDVDDRLDEVVDVLQDIDDRLRDVERFTAPDDDVTATEVVESLPPARPQSDWWKGSFAAEGQDAVAWEGTAEDVADYLGVSERAVGEMLVHVEDTPAVETGVVDGTKRYWSPDKSQLPNPRGDEEPQEVNPPIPDHLLDGDES